PGQPCSTVRICEPVVVVDADTEKWSDPPPPSRRIELFNAERRERSALQPKLTFARGGEHPCWIQRDGLDVFGPRQPRLDTREVCPRLLDRGIDLEGASHQLDHCRLLSVHRARPERLGRVSIGSSGAAFYARGWPSVRNAVTGPRARVGAS